MKKLLLLIGPLVVLLGLSAVVAQDEDATVAVAETEDLGEFLVDSEGMTLYLFTNDSPGMSACDEGCLENWPAFTAEEPLTLPDGVPGELTLIEREDGSEMVAYNDWPLYYFAGDEAEGDTNGQEAGDVWFVVEPAEAGAAPAASPAASPMASPAASSDTTVMTAETDDLGEFLVDAEGMTLYLFTNDMPGMSMCMDDCLDNWPVFTAEEPLTLPEGVPGELTLIERDDGSEMVAYNDMPLYYFAGDEAAGDTNGQEAGDIWFVVEPAEPTD